MFLANVLIPGSSVLRARVFGLSLALRRGDIPKVLGIHEPETSRWFRPSHGQTVIDVGAHVGRYSLLAAKCGARVIALEPDERNYRMLCANLSANHFNKAIPLQMAASDVVGIRKLYNYSGEDTWGSSL